MVASDTFEAWVIAWPPGGAIELHDHGGSSGAVVVAAGELLETSIVTQPSGGVGLRTSHDRRGAVHLLRRSPRPRHRQPDRAPAISVHVYAPRLTSMTYYRMTDGVLEAGATVRLPVRTRRWREHRPSTTSSSVPGDASGASAPTSSKVSSPKAASSSTSGPPSRRRHEGALPGAVVVERNVLEWRLDPNVRPSPARGPRSPPARGGGVLGRVCLEPGGGVARRSRVHAGCRPGRRVPGVERVVRPARWPAGPRPGHADRADPESSARSPTAPA